MVDDEGTASSWGGDDQERADWYERREARARLTTFIAVGLLAFLLVGIPSTIGLGMVAAVLSRQDHPAPTLKGNESDPEPVNGDAASSRP